MAFTWLTGFTVDGNVGIGTETPTAPLDVFGVRAGRDWALNGRAVIRLDSNGTSYPSDMLFGHTAAANQTSWTGVYWSLSSRGSSDAGKFHFYRGTGHDSPYNSEAVIMTFDPNLNVGIGTVTPDARLEVEKDVDGSFYSIFAKNPNAGSSAFVSKKWLNDDAGFGEIWRNSSTRSAVGQSALSFNMYNSADINLWSGGTHTMALVGDNVGIGTTNPDFKLDVEGTLGVSDLPGNVTSTSALVRNETIGPELLSNPDFATNTAWGGSGSIANGQLTKTGGGLAYQTVTGLVSGATYLIEVDVASIAGTNNFYLGGTQSSALIVGKQSFYLLGGGGNLLVGFNNGYSGSTGSVFNSVSLKLVTSASNQIQTRQLGTGAFGPTPVGAYLPLTAGSSYPLTDNLFIRGDDKGLVVQNAASTTNVTVGAVSSSAVSTGLITLRHLGVTKIVLNANDNSYFTGNVGIGVTGPGAKLDIVGSSLGIRVKKADLSDVLRVYTQGSGTFMDGGNVHISDDLKIGATLLSNQENTDIDTGAEVVAQVSTSTYTAAFFDFVVKKTTNVRSGTVYACHDGTNVEFTETSTNDLGDTSDVTLSVDISGTNMRLLATVTSDDWSVKSLIRAI